MSTKYRITKYDPQKRDEKGRFMDNSEWTSFYDIGKTGFEYLTFDKYKKVESKYVEAIKTILDEKKVRKLEIDSIERYSETESFYDLEKNISQLQNGLELEWIEIEKVIRLILREQVWMNLISSKVKVTFGYDYYMYVECEELQQAVIQKNNTTGLFLEKF